MRGQADRTMLPFTTDQFLAVFAAYNAATWPAPAAAYALAAWATWAALRAPRHAASIVAGVLSVLWIWTGAAYHAIFFAAVNPAAPAFGLAFVAQGLMFAWAAGSRHALPFAAGPARPADRRLGLGLLAYAAVLYPLLGRLAGHAWPAVPSFGVTPCPLTIVTFGLLLLARGRVAPVLLVVPAAWSLIGGSAAILLAVPQDWPLPVAGLLGCAVLLRRPRRTRLAAPGRPAQPPATCPPR